jgi:glycosyltransferase involved in cell wall biosynthesis
MTSRQLVSVVVPLLNEEESVSLLIDAVRDALAEQPMWELVLVDDGSTDGTREIVTRISHEDPRVRMVVLARNYGQSTAMQAGFDHARGEVVVTMDGDLQNDPRDIPMLLEKLSEGYDLVAGYRLQRQDKFVTRRVPSWVANWIIRWITGVPIRDNGCSLKAYRKQLLERMRLYSEMHRFIPALAASMGGAEIAEVNVRHHARLHGKSKYGLTRIFRVVADLLTIKMIRTFRLRPLVLFGSLAAFTGFMGALFVGAALLAGFSSERMQATSVVLPAIALLWLALGAFFMMLGLVGEVVIHQQWVGGVQSHPLLKEEETG